MLSGEMEQLTYPHTLKETLIFHPATLREFQVLIWLLSFHKWSLNVLETKNLELAFERIWSNWRGQTVSESQRKMLVSSYRSFAFTITTPSDGLLLDVLLSKFARNHSKFKFLTFISVSTEMVRFDAPFQQARPSSVSNVFVNKHARSNKRPHSNIMILVYTTQVNSAFRARWLASLEVISQLLFTSE